MRMLKILMQKCNLGDRDQNWWHQRRNRGEWWRKCQKMQKTNVYNEDKKNDDKKDSVEVNDETENDKNGTKEVDSDESDEKTENTKVNDANIDENET